MSKSYWQNVKEVVTILGIIVAIFVVVSASTYLSWQAYFQRFPNAEWWTFFFRR